MQAHRNRTWLAASVVATLAAMLLLAGTAVALAAHSPAPASQPAAAPTGPNSWSSGWITVTPGQVITLYHNLGGDPTTYGVDVVFKDTDLGGIGLNHRGYGGLATTGGGQGVHWQRLTANTIQVFRGPNDPWADQIRVRVWVAPTPDFASPWTVIPTDTCRVITHALNVTHTQLVGGVWFKDLRLNPALNLGINHWAYGGLEVSGLEVGAHWQELTDNTLTVCRHRDDVSAGQVRVAVSYSDPPDWDSGWQSISTGTQVFTHSLGWNPNALLVRAECRQPGLRGIHHLYAGGFCVGSVCQGANWQNLTGTSISVFRQPDDTVCSQMRLHIWKQGFEIYLPLVVRTG